MNDTIIDYRRYCVPKEFDARPVVNSPIRHGDCVFMTDGNIAFRFSSEMTFDPPITAISSPMDRSISALIGFFEGIEKLNFSKLPQFAPPEKLKSCEVCEGSGLAAFCAVCGGAGNIECRECGHETECENCFDGFLIDSTKPQVRCQKCVGSGVTLPDHGRIAFEHTWINYKYLAKILQFNNVRVAFDDPNNMIKFSFDGGHAIVMSMRDN